MREICKKLGVERATPHDLRRTNGTLITALGFGREAMNRIQNHKEGGIASVYDRHQYAEENKRILETVGAHIMALVEGAPRGNVVPFAANALVMLGLLPSTPLNACEMQLPCELALSVHGLLLCGDNCVASPTVGIKDLPRFAVMC